MSTPSANRLLESNPLIANAVSRAASYGVKVHFHTAIHSNTLEIAFLSANKNVRVTLDLSEVEDHGQGLIAIKIDATLAAFFNHESLETKELEAELHSYKEAVHMLSFQLEMIKDKQESSVVPHRSVVNIRKHALKQAAEFVMDWGVPKSGGDLVNLCKQIRDLPESKTAAVDRAMDDIDIAFKERS